MGGGVELRARKFPCLDRVDGRGGGPPLPPSGKNAVYTDGTGRFEGPAPDTEFRDLATYIYICTGGANNEYRGGPPGPGTGFCSLGGGFFSLRRKIGLPRKPPTLLMLFNIGN